MNSFSAVAVLTFLGAAFAADDWTYENQDEWPNICVTNNTMRQSPINIITQDVQFNPSLIDLQMEGYDMEYDGVFTHQGINVRFIANTSQPPTLQNHLGTYDFLNFHFHWGDATGRGSGHRVDSDQGELEIHFVHRKRGQEEMHVGDYLSVIAVIAEVDEDAELTGPWLQLDPLEVLALDDTFPITGLRPGLLLPESLDYYHYEGSFTSPPCYEIVNWFVLKERITIPGAYLEKLRMVQWRDTGEPIVFNFRMPQELAGRVVGTNSHAAAVVRPVLSVLLISLAMLVMLF